jgi:hypothetical protein
VPSDFLQGIKEAVDKEFAGGVGTQNSLWARDLEKVYADWGSQDVLVRLYRKGEMVTYFTEQLEQLARILEKTIGGQAAATISRGRPR